MNKISFINEKNDKIINILLKRDFSYNHCNKLLRNKDIRIDGVKISENIQVQKGSEVQVYFEEKDIKRSYDIVFQDEKVIIVNKPQGIEITGKDGLAQRLNAFAVHRLDRNTTGLVILARTKEAEALLLQAMKRHQIEKLYLAQVVGQFDIQNKWFNAYLFKDKNKSHVKVFSCPAKGAMPIATKFNTLSSSPASSIIECTILGGKTHQIRAHLAFLGHPIIGDGKYGKNEDNKKFKAKYQRLHCYKLIFHLDGILSYLNDKEFISYPNFYKRFSHSQL